MKGLLLKDLYMMRKYMKSYLVLLSVFVTVSWVEPGNMFFMFYPCMLAGTLPVSLLGYDERSNWEFYAGALPCTKAQIVSSKYLIGLMVQGAVLLIIAVSRGIQMVLAQGFIWSEYLVLIGTLCAMSCVSASFTLPFIFKFGVEKGRVAYYVIIGAISGISVFLPRYFQAGQQAVSLNGVQVVVFLVAVGVYALSWYLSIRFYEERELK